MRRSSVLVVDDDPAHRALLRDLLEGEVDEVRTAANGEECLRAVGQRVPGLILLDMRMPGLDGLGTLEALRERRVEAPAVVMTAYAEVDDAVRAMKLGAVDYVRKPIDLADLGAIVARYAGSAAQAAPAVQPAPEGFVFRSPIMRDLLGELRRVARTDVPVLLHGETGTGKEVLAELLHRWSPRAKGPLVGVNVAALPASLIENELFGHAKGAFTGADAAAAGRLEQAAGGTLFLDEIGEMPEAMQPKLLRVLESGRVARLGADEERRVDFRLVSATNRDLEEEIERKRFRLDLFYRLAVVAIEVPPLRERPEDLVALAGRFLAEATEEPKRLAPAAEERVLAYRWPGNIRELRNAMLRAAILAPGERVLPEHLPPPVREAEESAPRTLAAIERRAILEALRRCANNRTRAAQELGISRRKLLYRLKDYGLGR